MGSINFDLTPISQSAAGVIAPERLTERTGKAAGAVSAAVVI